MRNFAWKWEAFEQLWMQIVNDLGKKKASQLSMWMRNCVQDTHV